MDSTSSDGDNLIIHLRDYYCTCSENMTAGMLTRRVQGENRPQRTAVSTDTIKKSFGVYSYFGGSVNAKPVGCNNYHNYPVIN